MVVLVSMVLMTAMVVMVMLVTIVAIVVGRKKRDRMAGLEFGPCVPRVGWWTMVR